MVLKSQARKVFIIGAGVTASIVKLFVPQAKIIAPEGKGFLPVQYIWQTQETLRFVRDFKIPFAAKTISALNSISELEVELYNKVTHKPQNNKPSKGKKEIKALICNLPNAKIDIADTVLSVSDGIIQTSKENYQYDLVFMCSPLVFKPFSINYYPIRTYKCRTDFEPEWDYAYLGGKLLAHYIYRASHDDSCEDFFHLEQAGELNLPDWIVEELTKDELHIDVKVVGSFVNKFAHFDAPKKPNKDTKKMIFASRLAILDNEFLLSDLIKKMYGLRENGIC